MASQILRQAVHHTQGLSRHVVARSPTHRGHWHWTVEGSQEGVQAVPDHTIINRALVLPRHKMQTVVDRLRIETTRLVKRQVLVVGIKLFGGCIALTTQFETTASHHQL